MEGQILIVNVVELDTDPATHPDIRWQEEFLRLGLEQHGLHSMWDRDPHGDVSIIVMIVCKHGINFLSHEERRLAMGQLFSGLWQGCTDPLYPPQMFPASIGLRGSDGNPPWLAVSVLT